VDNKCLQQVKNFKYLGCGISYGNEKDASQKVAKCAQVLGILNNILKPNLVQKFSRIKVRNAVAVRIFLYGSENWSLRMKKYKKQQASLQKNFTSM
jgi:hypothetical protein